MAAAAIQNPSVRSESKSAKKKKAKAESAASTTPVVLSTPTETAPSNPAPESSNGDASYESPYIKELYKSIRNVNKKITNASKVDNILAENPKSNLDDLVAARKINADQKAQILKKPALQASLTQLEEQIAQYKKFDQEYKAKSQVEKAEFEKSFAERASKDLEDAVSTARAEGAAAAAKEQHSNLLLISQFLRLAAARRAEDADPSLDENMALEGVLVEVYSGDENAVATMIKLIKGSGEATSSIGGEKLQTTYAQVKASALAYAPAILPVPEIAEEPYGSPAIETTEYPTQSDPTIANAGLTELDATAATAQVNGHAEPITEIQGIPQNSGFGDGAANAAAESNWDKNAADLSASQEWVEVPRDITETDTGVKGTPAAPSNIQSWADEQPDSPPPANISASAQNDGFHEVQRSRGGNRDSQQRGRGGRGGENGNYRGRGGFRGNDSGHRGRGRGGSRGGGASRGRRSDES